MFDTQQIVFVTQGDMQEVKAISQSIIEDEMPFLLSLTNGIDFETFAEMRNWAIARDDEYAAQSHRDFTVFN